MGKRGPEKGSKYNTNKTTYKNRLSVNIATDLKAYIKRTARSLGISESMFMDNVFRKDMMGKREFLIFKYKEAVAEAEKWRHLLTMYHISVDKIEVEQEV